MSKEIKETLKKHKGFIAAGVTIAAILAVEAFVPGPPPEENTEVAPRPRSTPLAAPTYTPRIEEGGRPVGLSARPLIDPRVSDANFLLYENIRPKFLQGVVYLPNTPIVDKEVIYKTVALVGLDPKQELSISDTFKKGDHITEISGRLPSTLLPESDSKTRGRAYFLQADLMDWAPMPFATVQACFTQIEKGVRTEKLLWIDSKGAFELYILKNPTYPSCVF